MSKPFASSADLAEKQQHLEVLADGVYALTAEGDPNVGAIEGEDLVVCFEALATPVAARAWLARLREHTDKPIKYLILSHYHAVRVLGASAFDAQVIIAHDRTRELIAERGEQDWESEYGRMPRLFKDPESIPGLTWPTQTFGDRVTIDLGGRRGDIVLEHAAAATQKATSSPICPGTRSSSPGTSSRPSRRCTPATRTTGSGPAPRWSAWPPTRPRY